jgi:DNA polymerase family A
MAATELICAFIGTPDDKEYIPYLKGMFNGHTTFVCLEPITLLTHLEMYCAKKSITRVVSTSVPILQKLVEKAGSNVIPKSTSNYAGSVFTYGNLEIVFIDPLRQLFTVSYGKFLAARYISKVCAPDSWREATPFSWHVLDTSSQIEAAYHDLETAYAIAVDIETFQSPLSIRCIGYCGIFHSSDGRLVTRSYVLPLDSVYNLFWMRKINDLPAQKIFQNGKYDNAYLLRYNAVPRNWLWDTQHFFHCWYSELPKDLAFLNAFFLRKVVYWKDLAETADLYEYYKYNAMDTWATANVWIQQLVSAPDWVRRNYTLEFPLVFPCLLAEMTGLKRDQAALLAARSTVDAEESSALSSLQRMLGAPAFNPGSPVQVKSLLKLLGCADIESSNEKDLAKAKLRHPLNGRIIDKILTIRGLRKLATTYLRTDADGEVKKSTGRLEGGAKEFHGRVLYNLNPHGTDTGRLASREHHFWTGLQIQNVPRGEPGEPSHTKTTICADDGFYLGESDLEQAESRDTAYISGDTSLISAVSGTRDFHSHNASAFFGRPYESVYDDSAGKTKDKPLRDLSKRTNHGANYNMGPDVMVDTMGLDKVWMAKKLLSLPYLAAAAVAEHLLTKFHLTYPKLRGPIHIRNDQVRMVLGLDKCEHKLYSPGTYYASVAYEVTTTRRLTSRAFHRTEYNLAHYKPEDYIEQGDWTRYCFGKPDTSKPDLNALVAHCPQSLNARTLNEAWLRVFYQVALPNPETFRLHAQIHDSILFSYAAGHEVHAEQVKNCMEIPVTVRDISGTHRTFTVPAALKIGKPGQPAKYWSETE